MSPVARISPMRFTEAAGFLRTRLPYLLPPSQYHPCRAHPARYPGAIGGYLPGWFGRAGVEARQVAGHHRDDLLVNERHMAGFIPAELDVAAQPLAQVQVRDVELRAGERRREVIHPAHDVDAQRRVAAHRGG